MRWAAPSMIPRSVGATVVPRRQLAFGRCASTTDVIHSQTTLPYGSVRFRTDLIMCAYGDDQS